MAVVIVVVAAPSFRVGLGDGIMPQPIKVRMLMKIGINGISRDRCPQFGRHHRLPLGHMETEGNAVRGKKEEKDDQKRNEPTLEELLMHAITLRYWIGQAFHERAGVYRESERNVKKNSANRLDPRLRYYF